MNIKQRRSALRRSFEDIATPEVEVMLTGGVVGISKKVEGGCGPYFNAYILDSDPHTVNFGIKTIDSSGNRDPLFRQYRANELAAHAITYFKLGGDIRGINFNWMAPGGKDVRSDNYTTYLNARNTLQAEMSPEEARVAAAYATWTVQKIAIPNGFTEIMDVHEFRGMTADPCEVTGTAWRSDL